MAASLKSRPLLRQERFNEWPLMRGSSKIAEGVVKKSSFFTILMFIAELNSLTCLQM